MSVQDSRRQKLDQLRSRGVPAYDYSFPVTHRSARIRSDATALEQGGGKVRVAGRLMTKRGHGKASFAHLKDADGTIQIYLREDVLGPDTYAMAMELDLGDWVGVEGPVFHTKTGETTVRADSIRLLAKSLRPLPEKWHGLTDVETRYRQRYADLVVNDDVRTVFRARASILRAIREFLDGRGYLEVETPVLQPLYGGAAARPFVTHHNALDRTLYLRIAVELYLKRLIVGGLDRVYEIAKTFRNEGIDRFHNPEFTMLEYYQAFADYEEMMQVTQDLLLHTIRAIHGATTIPFDGQEIDFTPPWPRVTFKGAAAKALGVERVPDGEEELRALARKAGLSIDPSFTYGKVLDEIISERAQPGMISPVFLIDYPRDISPLAKPKRGDPSVVERFELMVAGMEVANAFSEQNDPAEQRQAFEAQLEQRRRGDEEAQLLDEDYLRALELGMPPTGGVGIGIDRLVMLLTDSRSIRDVVLFPQMRAEEVEAD
ncbi:MAG TPA: lysine--tRNA ligase [Candidatus Eisenbacteria bacterium]|nr:lysine--tRNA ligase [Candidatus Eisenbacteria bacterium]